MVSVYVRIIIPRNTTTPSAVLVALDLGYVLFTDVARRDLSAELPATPPPTYAGTAEMVAEGLRTLVDAGIDYFIVTIPRNAYDHEAQTRFAREVVPMFTR